MPRSELPLVLIPRYTAYVGQGTYATIGLDVTMFESARITAWRGVFLGVGTSFRVTFQESDDQDTWVTCADTTPDMDLPEDTEVVVSPTFSRRYFRIQGALAGPNAGVTCRATGFLVRRER
jgi:hypothetical protein